MFVSLNSTQYISIMHPSYFIKHHHLIGYITILSGISMITMKLYTSHIMASWEYYIPIKSHCTMKYQRSHPRHISDTYGYL